jgi:hypothetical protein
MIAIQPRSSSPSLALLLAILLGPLCTLPADAAVYQCTIPKLRGNDFVCREYPNLCNFIFVIDERTQRVSRRDSDKDKPVPVTVDKWEENKIIAHEDLTRTDSRFIEQYFYKIELDSGNFLFANEYVTNKGRYLTQEDIKLADPKSFGYYKPRLFSERGRCTLKPKD